MSRILAAAAFAAIATPVTAQNNTWVGYSPPPATSASPLPVTGNEYIEARCNLQAPGNYRCSDNPNAVRTYFVPLSEFARAHAVDRLRDEVEELRNALPAQFEQIDRNISRSSALASVLDHNAPLDLSRNRLGFSTSDFDGRAAIGVNYSRRAGQVDFGVAVGAAGSSRAAKLSAGLSW